MKIVFLNPEKDRFIENLKDMDFKDTSSLSNSVLYTLSLDAKSTKPSQPPYNFVIETIDISPESKDEVFDLLKNLVTMTAD